jgi:hypothetical protein
MARAATSLIPHLGTFIVCTVGMSLSVLAAPSLNKVLSPDRATVAGEASRSIRSVPAHLDLRLPDHVATAALPPSESHGGMSRATETRPGDVEASLRPLGTIAPRPTVQSMVEHFHREGLPVARLWENHSALVSLGLNGKGKPGLWLVQKTH